MNWAEYSKMSQTSDELNENIDKLMHFVLRRSALKNNEDILLLLEKLCEDLKISRETISVLQKNLNGLLIHDKIHLNSKFILLKERYDKLEAENISLKEQINELKAQSQSELEIRQHEFITELKEHEKKSQDRITKIEKELEKVKISSQNKGLYYQNNNCARAAARIPLDFFLWGYLRTKVYANQPESLDDLRERIESECRQLNPAVLSNVREAFQNRLYHCMEVNGTHFEHLL